MNNRIWTEKYQQQAQSEGWNVFEVNDGTFRIQKIDDMAAVMPPGYTGTNSRFKTDNAAIRFVRRQAQNGENHAWAAIALLHNRPVNTIDDENWRGE